MGKKKKWKFVDLIFLIYEFWIKKNKDNLFDRNDALPSMK